MPTLSPFGTTYADELFSPQELSPKIWLDAIDLDANGVGDTGYSDGSVVSAWSNKGTLGVSGDPTLTHGNLSYEQWAYNW